MEEEEAEQYPASNELPNVSLSFNGFHCTLIKINQ